MLSKKLKDIALVLLPMALSSCVFGTSDNPDTPVASKLCLEVMGERYEVALPASQPLSLRALTAEFPVDVKVLNAAEFISVTIDGQTVKDGVCTCDLSAGIPQDGQLKVEYTTASQQGSFLINTFPEGAPKYSVWGQGQIPGHFYLSYIYQPLVMKVDNDGRLLYYRFDPTKYTGTFKELGCWDFKKHVFDGKTYYSYHAPDPAYADRATTGYVPGMRILMDDHYVPVDTIHALGSLDGYLPEGAPLDGHDFYFFSPTHWIASASYVQREAGGAMRAAAYLQEVENGKVVFDWWSTDFPDLLDWGSPAFDTSNDYVHFNAIDVLPDGHWLVSLRAVSSVIKIDRQQGGIMWRLSGEDTSRPTSQQFSGQHYVRWHHKSDGDYLTIFDNGNNHDPILTHVLRLKVQSSDTAIQVLGGGDLLNNQSDYFTQACGALDDFGSQGFVVGWGWSMDENNCDRLVSEFDADGHEVFRLTRFDDLDPYSVNPSYRCVKCQ